MAKGLTLNCRRLVSGLSSGCNNSFAEFHVDEVPPAPLPERDCPASGRGVDRTLARLAFFAGEPGSGLLDGSEADERTCRRGGGSRFSFGGRGHSCQSTERSEGALFPFLSGI